jgi:hypothetical protein
MDKKGRCAVMNHKCMSLLGQTLNLHPHLRQLPSNRNTSSRLERDLDLFPLGLPLLPPGSSL